MADLLKVERTPSPVRAQVVDNLRQAIIDRKLAPGQRLIERELIELTGVSRTSVREALRELAAEGLVRVVPNQGMIVNALSVEEARQLYQIRSALEGLAGRLFVENATEADRKALERAFNRVEKLAQSGSSILTAKDKFYDVLFSGGGNLSLRAVVESLHARVSLQRSLSLSVAGRSLSSAEELRAILVAVLAGDADAAAAACSRHVEEAGRIGVQALRELEQGDS
jgi:DNA-binding GntR family transcriptional regulator